jgi:Putative Ig domain/Carbohydrate binding domain
MRTWLTQSVPVVDVPLSGHPVTMDPGTVDGTGAGERPPSYVGQRRLHRTFLGRTGALLPLVLVAASVVTVLLVLAVSAMLPSEAAPIPGTRAGSSDPGAASGAPRSGPAGSAAPGPGSTALTVTNPGVQTGSVGVAVRLQIQVAQSASAQRLTWSASGLPRGLTVDSRTGLVTGTPSVAGSSTVTVTVRNAANVSTSVTFVWTVSPTNAAGIRNGGFEEGLAPWTCGGGTATVVDNPVHGGGHALRGAPTAAYIAQCTQSVAVTPNTRYTLSAWVSGSYAYVGVTGPGMSDANTWATTPAETFSKLTVAFTTGASTTSVTIYVHGWYGQGTYFADDVSLA